MQNPFSSLCAPLSAAVPSTFDVFDARCDQLQVQRAMRIKSEYLSKTQHELGSKRKEAETHAEGGILGLDLLKAVQERQKEAPQA